MGNNVLRDALTAALAPSNDVERHVIAYLATVAPRQVPTLVEMLGRAANTARAEGYEHGWREGVQHGRTGGTV